MSPELRTTIYALASAVLTLLVIFNIIQQDRVEPLLDIVGSVLGAVGPILAFIYRPTKKPVVDEAPTHVLEAEVSDRKGE